MKSAPPQSDDAVPGEWIDDTAPDVLQTLAAPPQRKSSMAQALATIAAVAAALGFGYWLRDHQSTPDTTIVVANAAPTMQRPVVVHVSGRVRNPGVYQLKPGARLKDALTQAGGVLPDGDANALNLAAPVEDGRKIEVPPRAAIIAERPTTSELPTSKRPMTSSRPMTSVSRSNDKAVRSRRSVAASKYFEAAAAPPQASTKLDSGSTLSASHPAASAPQVQRPLDLNRATSAELEALPGIGPALAARIVAFRQQNGGFAIVDDLDDVEGIGEKRLETLRPLVEVR